MTFRTNFEHRDALLAAALEEFCGRGYDAASVNRILSAAGMSKGQLYHHFTNKEGLFLALVEWMIDEKLAWFATHPPQSSDDFFTTLDHLLRATVAFTAARVEVDQFSRAVLSERGRPIFDAVVRRFAFDPDSAVATLVAYYYEQGQLRNDLSLEFVQRALLHTLNHLPDLLDLGQPADLGPKVDEVLAFMRGGLGA